MESERLIELRQLYSDRLASYGYSPKTLGWNKPKAGLRYKILMEYWESIATGERPLKLLDFGCGFGDLFGWCKIAGLPVDYHGIDMNADLIRAGRSVYPDLRLDVGTPVENGLSESYDVIVASGAHNYRLEDTWKYIENTFELFNRHSQIGFSINFLSDKANFQRKNNYYSNAGEILNLSLRYSSRSQLRHDYMPFEFTAIVDKRANYDQELTVFEDYRLFCSD